MDDDSQDNNDDNQLVDVDETIHQYLIEVSKQIDAKVFSSIKTREMSPVALSFSLSPSTNLMQIEQIVLFIIQIDERCLRKTYGTYGSTCLSIDD